MTNDTLTPLTETTTLELGKTPREALRLPQLHFIVMDDWLDKLGEKSFCLWLKLLTKVDRTDDRKNTVKYSQKALAESLGMAKSTMLRLLKPLYEYGLIEYTQYTFDTNKHSAENIVIFEMPQNNPALQFAPLQKCRSWEQRTEEKFNYSKRGGRPKSDALEVVEADLPKGMQDLPKEEPKPVKKAKEVAFNENVNPIVITEFEHWKSDMLANKVDLNVVIKWVNKNVDKITYNQMCYVLKQLATYSEDIQKTGAFISSTMKKAPAIYYPITSPVEPVTEEPAFQPQVKLYNFLEEKGDKPAFNNDDLPF
ncbi:hypothetical protein ACQKOK_28265 [Bacillus cereus]|uniref:hypothetical protein n=1 Tax=Bacillus cereus TaxID=1396 RepID=UPI003D06F453